MFLIYGDKRIMPITSVLLIHSRQDAGGVPSAADHAYARIRMLLRQAGVRAHCYCLPLSHHYGQLPWYKKHIAWFWNYRCYASLNRVMRRTFPDIVHVFNVYPTLSPAVYWSAAGYVRPVVQSLHDPHMIGMGEEVDKAAALISRYHRAVGSWRRHVHHWIVDHERARQWPVLQQVPDQRISTLPLANEGEHSALTVEALLDIYACAAQAIGEDYQR